ncbi:MAG: CHAP domain-containing protein [Burkholderiaceae bacterium]
MDIAKSVAYLDAHAQKNSLGRCAEFVRKAVEAGGVHLRRHTSAKDYGSSLEAVGFETVDGTSYLAGDVAIIQPIPGHPHGHMTMFDGKSWISDFKQLHGLYPGASYRTIKPPFKVYRYARVTTPVAAGPTARAYA